MAALKEFIEDCECQAREALKGASANSPKPTAKTRGAGQVTDAATLSTVGTRPKRNWLFTLGKVDFPRVPRLPRPTDRSTRHLRLPPPPLPKGRTATGMQHMGGAQRTHQGPARTCVQHTIESSTKGSCIPVV